MADFIYAIIDRIGDFFALASDFVHYIVDRIVKDKGFRIRFIGILAALAALVCGIVIFSHQPAKESRDIGNGLADIVEVTGTPVVEEIDLTPTPEPAAMRRQVDSSAVATGSGLRQINEYVAAGRSGQELSGSSEESDDENQEEEGLEEDEEDYGEDYE